MPVAPLAGLCRFGIPSVWQAEEAVANLPVRLAVRVRCGHQACAQRYTPGVLQRHPISTLRFPRGTRSGYAATGLAHTGHYEARNALPLERVCEMTLRAAAGARAARYSDARSEPAAATDCRCRCAARGVRGGVRADLAAVGFARDGLRGDRRLQGASRDAYNCVHVGCTGHGNGPTRSRRVHSAFHRRVRAVLADRAGPAVCLVLVVLLLLVACSTGFRRGPVSDVECTRRLLRSSGMGWRDRDCSDALGGCSNARCAVVGPPMPGE